MLAIVIAAACGAGAEESISLPGVSFIAVGRAEQPTAMASTPAGPEGLWVAEQAGRVVTLTGAVVLDIRDRVSSGGETGLLGLAFAPGWPSDPRVVLNYTAKSGGKLRTRIASFRSVDGGKTLDATTEGILLQFEQPYSNHNGGPVQFGPDGFLYVGVGDGGSGGDPHGTGQDRSDLLGSILRIDVSTTPYRVPPDNPFVNAPAACPEVWAYGLRNPWGMHFDGATLWWADVGQHAWEEVDRGVVGGNYGWNRMEGTHCFGKAPCAGAFQAPVAEYGHDEGQSVTGGFVYRGPSIPAIDAHYVFADFASGLFFAVPAAGGALSRLGSVDLHPSTFGRGRDGSMYVADYGGAVYRLVAR